MRGARKAMIDCGRNLEAATGPNSTSRSSSRCSPIDRRTASDRPTFSVGVSTRGEQEPEGAVLSEPRGEVCAQELALRFLQKTCSRAQDLLRHPVDRPCRPEQTGMSADTAERAGVQIVHFSPGQFCTPSI